MQQNNGIDKKQMISFAVLCLILFGAMFYFQNKQMKEEELKAQQQKTEQVKNAVKQAQATNINPNVTPGAIQTANLSNKELNIEFSSLGGQVSKVQLSEYKAYNNKTDQADLPLYLINKNNSNYGFQFKDKTGKVINTKDLVFTPAVNGNAVTMTANYNGAVIQFIYTLLPKYTLDFKVRTQGLSAVTSDNKADFIWDYNVRNLEKGRAQEQSHSEFSYAFNNYKDYDYDGRTTMDEEKETLNWIGVKQQFFSSVIEAKNGFTQSKGNQENVEEGEYLKKFNYEGFVQMTGSELNQDFTWYFMPLDLPLLKSYDKNFDEILPLGWSFIGAMNRYFFMWLYAIIASWGLSAGWVIFAMTIIVKLILSPIMYKQHKLSAMMKVIRPEIDEVNAKFKDADPMKKQQATMEVYRKAGVNQMAGCLPALVQIPIFYALFRFFPNFIDLRGQGFWFAKDLTAYDDLIKLPFKVPFLGDHLSIFALACTIVILIYTVMTSGNMQQPQQEGMPNMKVLMYIFPITFLFFLNTSASGLSWYYFVSNAINILIILVIKYVILDEKKIHAQIQANKEKPKTEGKFQKKMREMMEQAQQQQQAQEQQRKKK
ncbi:membrane protein insertase YidC [Chryseobacterium bernardetii]|uniref:Membrane protein insertase YidC n=1 Tax=Chryseobacterium bernardetii TaxID=1241978 RepID=A0A3G6U5G8_9FLAO|nr:membrane protein insertase YidC [Chryseobacterium bernardetii]AZB23471.1 membrane protein insertase YidC [Chryseobacterium bernardetii]AZB34156.1 membrane protein insertase YidC [Chryseobacterium bernardetii]